MSIVSVKLYVNNKEEESFVADIPDDKLDIVKLSFIDLMSEALYKYEKDDIETEENQP